MKYITLLVLSIIIVSCKNTEKQDHLTAYMESKNLQNVHPGKKLMETYCYVCHNPNMPENGTRIAPPMAGIKFHYINDNTTKEQFISDVVAFTNNPTADNARLFGAVRKFGVMPKQQFPEGVVEKIADYMFDHDIEEPDWFQDHVKGEGNGNGNGNGFGKNNQQGKQAATNNTPKTIEDIGLEYALSTKKVLGQNLMSTIQKKGTLEALAFCNIQAIPLTDSMSTNHNAVIKRVSDKNRNPDNKANAEELKYIDLYKAQVALNQEPKPSIIEKGDKIQFYYPITTNSMYLQCHGTSKDISTEVREKMVALYPNDLALGYSENQVRGIWSIEFDNPKNN